MASGSDLEVHSLPTQQLETDSVPKENGPAQEEAQSVAEVADNSQPASLGKQTEACSSKTSLGTTPNGPV